MFTTNGFETYFWDDKTSPQRPVSGIFSKDDLQKMMNRRSEHKDLMQIPIDENHGSLLSKRSDPGGVRTDTARLSETFACDGNRNW